MTKTRKEILIIGLMLLLVMALIGVSYAAFRFMGVGQREKYHNYRFYYDELY